MQLSQGQDRQRLSPEGAPPARGTVCSAYGQDKPAPTVLKGYADMLQDPELM